MSVVAAGFGGCDGSQVTAPFSAEVALARDADDEGDEHHRPVHPLLAEGGSRALAI